jgi:ribose transport system permease protein
MKADPSATPEERSPDVSGPSWFRPQTLANYLGLLGVLLLLIVLFSAMSNRFLTPATLRIIANQIPDLTVIAVGMTFVLIVAGIDLSVGSVMALSAAVLGVAMVDGRWPLPAAVAACLSVGLLCGLVNGAITVGWKIPSFIVTLGMLEMARGGAYLVTESQTKYIGPRIEILASPLPGIGFSTAALIAVAVVVAGQLVLSCTLFGRYMTAIGHNEQVVRYSGIDPRPTKIAVFAVAGLLAALGGVFQTSRLGSADPNGGIGLELAAIAAVVIGGTSLMGGRGSVVSSFLGVLIIAVLQTGLAQVGATEPMKRIITGGVIIVAVIADVYRYRLSALRPSGHAGRKRV